MKNHPEKPLPAQIVDELEPLMVRGRRAMARSGWLRTLSSTHLHVLMLLEMEQAVSMSRLAEHLDVSDSNVTGIVGRMEERGFVERVRDEGDRRLVLVQATEAGQKALREIESIRREHIENVVSHMDASDQRLCLRAFRVLRETAERCEPHLEPGCHPSAHHRAPSSSRAPSRQPPTGASARLDAPKLS